MVAVKSQSVVINAKSFLKNSSLITFGFNLLTNNVLWCDELNFQLITSVTYGHMNMSLSLFRLTSNSQIHDLD